MREFSRPKDVFSRCLELAHCQYNGEMLSSPVDVKLKKCVDFLPVCPEVEAGLGVPVNPVRILNKGSHRLVQPSSMKDVTENMKTFCSRFLDSLEGADGFILKFRSLSSGFKDLKVYLSAADQDAVEKTSGYFGGAVLKMYPFLRVEEEGRIRNARIKEHFLTKLFKFAAFGKVKSESSMKNLICSHTQNKFLLMAYNQAELWKLGEIAANGEGKPLKELTSNYEKHLYSAFSRTPAYTSPIDVLMQSPGYFSDQLSNCEKTLFFDWVQKYGEGKASLCPAINRIKLWMERFESDYLMHQTFFKPYPEDLMEIGSVESHLRKTSGYKFCKIFLDGSKL